MEAAAHTLGRFIRELVEWVAQNPEPGQGVSVGVPYSDNYVIGGPPESENPWFQASAQVWTGVLTLYRAATPADAAEYEPIPYEVVRVPELAR